MSTTVREVLSQTGSNIEVVRVTEVPDKYSWDLDGKMGIEIFCNGKRVMGISIHEVLDMTPRKDIENHIAEIERTPWIKAWHGDKK